MASYDPQWIIHPRTEIIADGWRSTAGELIHHGWHFEKQYQMEYLATIVLIRNPSSGMVGRTRIADESMHRQDYYPTYPPYMLFDEQLVLKAELYKEMQIPQGEVYEVRVGECMRSPDCIRGTRELDESIFRWYTPDNKDTQEIIVTPDKVPMLLEEIRKAQEPRAKEILSSQRKRDMQELSTKAKILSFG